MRKKSKSGIIAIASVIIATLLHYVIFSNINMHPTLHALIGILMFFIVVGSLTLIFKKK